MQCCKGKLSQSGHLWNQSAGSVSWEIEADGGGGPRGVSGEKAGRDGGENGELSL